MSEPYLGGFQLGALDDYDIEGYTLIHFTQKKFDELMEEYYEEYGYYPGTITFVCL